MLSLNIEKRDQLRKKAKDLYKNEQIPGVLYGPSIKPTPVSIETKEFEKVYAEAGESMLVSIQLKDEKEKAIVLIRNPQRNVVTRDFIHTDFYQLPLDKPVEVTVSIEATEESPAVKEQGGVLIKGIQEVLIKTLPKSLIHEISVDISRLKTFDDVITIKDLNLPKEVEILEEDESVVFSVQQPKTQAEIDKEEQEEALEDSTTETVEPEKEGEEDGEQEQEDAKEEG